MTLEIGFDAQVPSLPQGGGAVASLGQTFSPDLTTGTGSFGVPIDCPNGPNDIGPRLQLRYDTTSGNGPFGMGFSLPLPRILRSTANGFPRYDASDTLMLEGAGPLLDLGGGSYRLQVDAGAWQVAASGPGFRLTSRDGVFYFLGTTAQAQLTEPLSGQVFAWHLERIEDALGNAATFAWRRDGTQLYPGSIAWGDFRLDFDYEPRLDPSHNGRAGFLVTTALRCRTISLLRPQDPQPLLRRWSLTYAQASSNGTSCLVQITLAGFDAALSALEAPPLRLGYSELADPVLERFRNEDDSAPPPPLKQPLRRVDLLDWSGTGRPALLEISLGGGARLWPNLGGLRWGRPRTIPDFPAFASGDMAFADMDGDGFADILRLDAALSGYVPREPGGGFGRPVLWRQAPSATAGSPDARLVDLDGDGVLDLLETSSDWLALYYRQDPQGWVDRPQIVRRSRFPEVRLSDPHIYLSDMTGDGSDDLVRVTAGGVVYWPYLGLGRWGDPVVMADPPDLPFNVDIERVFLTDVDGDGCADLVYLGVDRVIVWINRSGNGFSPARIVDFVPTGRIRDLRLADMRGAGTAGLLWSMDVPSRAGTPYYFLDFGGAAKPYLLNRIESGLGLVTTITYGTSAAEIAAAVRPESRPVAPTE